MNNMDGSLQKEKHIKHKIGWCANCGWVHGIVKAYMFTEQGHNIIKTLCPKCREKDRTADRLILCAVCGQKQGATLYPVTIEKLNFDEENTCNMLVPLCEACRQKSHSEIRSKLGIIDMCETCNDRFSCYTCQHGKPLESRLASRYGGGIKGFHKNARSRRGRF